MVRIVTTAAALLIVALSGSSALAGVYTDDLSKCLVKSSNAGDQATLVEWIFATVALNPAVKSLSTVTSDQRDSLNRQAVALMQRLMLVDCRHESVDAIRYEGAGAAEDGFKVLGAVAMRGLMSDLSVAEGIQGLDAYLDQDKWAELGKEAGLSAQTAPAETQAK